MYKQPNARRRRMINRHAVARLRRGKDRIAYHDGRRIVTVLRDPHNTPKAFKKFMTLRLAKAIAANKAVK
jgi:hypothetical protein